MEKIKTYYNIGIIALIPMYINMKGDTTKIITKTGEYYINRKITTILNLLAKYCHIDIRQTRKYYGNKIGCKILVPIPFDRENIFTPVKVRRTISKNDSSFAYVNIKYIEKVKEIDKLGVIYLKKDIKIDTKQKINTITKNIRNAQLVSSILKSREMNIGTDSFLLEYNTPATKADILALRNDIMYIKQKLSED